MGLTNIIQYFNGIEYTSDVPIEVAQKFKSCQKYHVIQISKYNDNYHISFNGKAYNTIIMKLTQKSLYCDLTSKEIHDIYEKLKKIFDNINEESIDRITQAYEYNYNLEDWIYGLTNVYVPSPSKIIGLKEIFKICHENNFNIYASS